MQGKLHLFKVLENGKLIGQVFAPDQDNALELAKMQYPNRDITVVQHDTSYRTK